MMFVLAIASRNHQSQGGKTAISFELWRQAFPSSTWRRSSLVCSSGCIVGRNHERKSNSNTATVSVTFIVTQKGNGEHGIKFSGNQEKNSYTEFLSRCGDKWLIDSTAYYPNYSTTVNFNHQSTQPSSKYH
mmetsp:Transcript_14279/g.30253  ORF Transcript_14279/g.30253 Transcript_14279/m.30253 type:complete len:131 (-) Transcript_14279:2115-2507(-)